jgi:hypothetical protein
MGAKQSMPEPDSESTAIANKTKGVLVGHPELENPTVEVKGDRDHLVSLLDLQVGTTEAPGADIIEWRDGLGFQSKTISLRGPRWIAHNKRKDDCDVVAKEGAAFVKLLPNFTVKELQELLASQSHETAEVAARTLGKTEEEVSYAGKDAMKETATAALNPAEPSLPLARERFFLRKWWDAVDSGELKLPDCSLLVIPRLFENVIADEHEAEQEERPTLLVMDDLASMGFKPRKIEDMLNEEEAKCLVQALADLHSAMWSIRDEICQGPFAELIDSGSPPTGVVTSVAATTTAAARTGVDKAGFASLIRQAIEESVPYIDKPETLRPKETDVDLIVESAFDTDVGLRLLCHGDPWFHNFMIRCDESGCVTGVAFVDFSSVRKANIFTDLFGFLYTAGMVTRPVTGVKLSDIYLQRLRPQLPLELTGEDMNTFTDRVKTIRAISNAFCNVMLYFVDAKLFSKNRPCVLRRLMFLSTCAFQAEKANSLRVKEVDQSNQAESDKADQSKPTKADKADQ